jgi:hypothetical protein
MFHVQWPSSVNPCHSPALYWWATNSMPPLLLATHTTPPSTWVPVPAELSPTTSRSTSKTRYPTTDLLYISTRQIKSSSELYKWICLLFHWRQVSRPCPRLLYRSRSMSEQHICFRLINNAVSTPDITWCWTRPRRVKWQQHDDGSSGLQQINYFSTQWLGNTKGIRKDYGRQ